MVASDYTSTALGTPGVYCYPLEGVLLKGSVLFLGPTLRHSGAELLVWGVGVGIVLLLGTL